MAYYVKTVWPPGKDNYPDGIIHFPTKTKKISEKFKKCDGFFIYETGKARDGMKGNKTIFAYGKISQNQKGKELEEIKISDGKEFRWGVRVEIFLKVDSFIGIPKEKIGELGIKQFQIPGGLIEITKDQFDKLCLELEKCSARDQK